MTNKHTFTILYDILMSSIDDHAVVTIIAAEIRNEICVVKCRPK